MVVSMKTLYFECNMGAAGDMLTAALLELLPDKNEFIDKMNTIGIPGVEVKAEPSIKCGITGTHVAVSINGTHEYDHHHGHSHEHSHSGMHEIEHILSHLPLSEKIHRDVLSIYQLIADAESQVHGKPVDKIHFHEVGNKDAIADIVGICLLMEMLSPAQILASPIHVGSGQVHCAHGVLPVPAPATAIILQDVPIYGGAVNGELCTPTGAAILKYFVSNFGEMPVMKVSQIGYGMGHKDFEAANCVRAILGESGMCNADNTEKIIELCCNLDDMTPEEIGFAQERLFDGGAFEVYTTAIGMKKCRPGVLLSCMCKEKEREDMVKLIFKYTTTLGIREYVCNRYTLKRTEHVTQTQYGRVRVKSAEGWGVERKKVEYEDLARIAREKNLAISEVYQALHEE